MEKDQKDHIKRNLPKLVNGTKNEPTLVMHLKSKGFISQGTWDSIKAQNHDDVSRYSKLYEECQRTPNYEGLIECLKQSDNDYAANILREFGQPAQNERRASNTSSTAGGGNNQAANSTPKSKDFVVEEKHKKFITSVLGGISPATWEEVKIIWLSQTMRNSAGKKDSMKLDIMSCLDVWMNGTTKDERLFSKITEAFEDYPSIVEKLWEAAPSTP